MPVSSDRPYGKSSISEMEAVFRNAKADPEILRMLENELGHRRTNRALKLRSMVAEARVARPRSGTVAPSTASSEGPTTTGTSGTATLLNAAKQSAVNVAPKPKTFSNGAAVLDAQDFEALPSFQAPKGMNEPAAILAAWTALEALSPQTYRRPEDLVGGDRRCVVSLSAGGTPWDKGERSRPNYQLYYQVVLGSISMQAATEELVKAFGDNEERNQRAREKAAIGAVLLNRDGTLVEENGIAVSSFAWALPLALKLRLGDLGAWPNIETDISEKLDAVLGRVDRDGKPVPLDLATIDKAHRFLVALFGLPSHLVEPPTFALRIYHYYKARNPPEVLLLNSFFLGDLARAAGLVRQNTVPMGLRRYLGIEKSSQTFDLLNDQHVVERAIAPAMMPRAQWPAIGGHSLVMLQQAAVNLIRSELAGTEGMIAVNGPPGHGKDNIAQGHCRGLRSRPSLGNGCLRAPREGLHPFRSADVRRRKCVLPSLRTGPGP
jgi:hypothetical protein